MKRQFREPSQETRTKMSLRKQGCNNPMYSKKHSEQSKSLISQSLKKYWESVPSKNNCNNIDNQ